MPHNLAKHVLLAHPPCNELGVLRAKVENEDQFIPWFARLHSAFITTQSTGRTDSGRSTNHRRRHLTPTGGLIAMIIA
jgi:hypothetical protein